MSDSAARELPLLLGRHRDQSETLLLIGVPDNTGIVHVRGWSADDWSAPIAEVTQALAGLIAVRASA